MRASVRAFAIVAANVILLLIASLVAMRLLYRATYVLPPSVWNEVGGEYARFSAAHVVPYVLSGLLASRWSQRLAYVALPAGGVVATLLTLLAMAMYGADGGEPQAMLTFLVHDVGGLAVVLTATASAACGWLLGRRYRRPAIRTVPVS
jgi:hypothetical protein